MASLQIVERPNLSYAFAAPPDAVELTKDETLLGRDPQDRGIDLQLHEMSITRRHAKVLRYDDAYWVEDLRTRNGTFLNDVRVIARETLRDGDRLRIGGFMLVFRSDEG